jgi:hypothetical protein
MHRRLLARLIASMLVAAAVAAAGLRAEEISALLKKAGSAYKAGNYDEAISTLDYAGQLIRQKKSDALVRALPSPHAGWTADEPSSEAAPDPQFGGTVAAQRIYVKGDARVTIRVAADSPLLAGPLTLIGDPLLMTGSAETIQGEKALVTFDPVSRSGDIHVVVNGRVLVTVEGREISREELTGYVAAIDFSTLGALS